MWILWKYTCFRVQRLPLILLYRLVSKDQILKSKMLWGMHPMQFSSRPSVSDEWQASSWDLCGKIIALTLVCCSRSAARNSSLVSMEWGNITIQHDLSRFWLRYHFANIACGIILIPSRPILRDWDSPRIEGLGTGTGWGFALGYLDGIPAGIWPGLRIGSSINQEFIMYVSLLFYLYWYSIFNGVKKRK